jgi:pyrroline-5-carboxylate reductase
MTSVFVGGGNMATALVGALVREGIATGSFRIIEPLAEQRQKLAERFPGIVTFAVAASEALGDAELVVLAVKPQQMQAAAQSLAPFLASGPAVLSIAAGIRLTELESWLGGYRRLIRAMPNTPALVGKGNSGAYAMPGVDADGKALATRVLSAGGEVLWVEHEAMLDAITRVSGSGPAYVFYFIEALEAAARELGFPPHDARQLAYATFDGALALAQSSDAEPAVLRAQVTSKGGTTERALQTLEHDGVKAKIVAAVKAAAERAKELGDAFASS